MSDSFEAVVDTQAQASEAKDLARRVLEKLVVEQIVQSELDPEAVLGGDGGYRPGKKLPKLYKLERNEGKFWTLRTNGLEIETKPWFNVFGTTCFEGISCPKCSAQFQLSDSFGDAFSDAVGKFYDGNSRPNVTCPSCQQVSAAPDWNAKPHLGFANLTFIFWNWPPLGLPSWNIDIAKLIADTTKHAVVTTYGRV